MDVQFSQPLLTVTPTLDGPVLAALALAEETFSVRQIRNVIGQGSEEGIRKVLRRLTAQGTVITDQFSDRMGYRFNRDHLAAQHIIGLAGLHHAFLTRLGDLLQAWNPQPVYGAVFGSAATGMMRPDSDIDLLLIRSDDADESAWDANIDDLVQQVTSWTGNDTRPLVYTVREVDDGTDEPVLTEAMNTGVVVLGPPRWLRDRLRRPERDTAIEGPAPNR